MNLSRLTLEWEPLDDQSQGNAGLNVTTAQNVICIGRPGQNVNNTCFIGNIFAVTTGIADAINIVVDSNGQLGTMSSPRKPIGLAPVSQVRITTADNFGLWPQRVKTRDAFILRADGVLNWKQRFRLTPWVGHTNKLPRGSFPEKSGAIPDRQSSCQELFFASNREPQNRDFSATCSPASCKDQIKTNTAEEKERDSYCGHAMRSGL